MMYTFYTDAPKGKFIALFSDGSGGNLFWRLDDQDGLSVYCDADGEIVPDPETYFFDAGYSHWLPIDENYEFWFERS